MSELLSQTERERALAAALSIARRAGALLQEGRRQGFAVQHKGAVDLVTEHDRRSEALVIEALQQRFPDWGIVGEEGGAKQGAANSPTWYVDPLDGTTNYAHGLPLYAVSIGLLLEGTPQVGVVLAPEMGWEFAARAGGGATLNGRPLAVSQATTVGDALLATGFPYNRATVADNNLAEFSAVFTRCQGIRRLGSAALDCALVAAGLLDGYWEHNLNPWDICAGALLVSEAGGRLSDYCGESFSVSSGRIVASNGRIHDELLGLLRGAHGASAS